MAAGESKFLYEDRDNSFRFEPDPSHEDMATMSNRAGELGYRLLFRKADYSLEEVQSVLHEEGPSALLNEASLKHDISLPAPRPSIEDFVSARLARLAPQTELIVTDSFLFTNNPQPDADTYVASVVRLISPLLVSGAAFTAVVDSRTRSARVEEAVRRALTKAQPGLQMKVFRSNVFHDRFWIADGSRGTILGSSLNKMGSKVFFIDALSDADVAAVISELRSIGV